MNAPQPIAIDPSIPYRVPLEFRYRENQHKPEVQKLRRWFERLLRTTPDLSPEVIERIAAAYFMADPVAEAFVDEIYLRGPGAAVGRSLLDQALEQGVGSVPDAPESMQRLFSELEQPPAWLDRKQVELGAQAFRRFGPAVYLYLGAVTLEAYRENSVAKPLVMTGAYAGGNTRQRFLETAAFWRDVSAPGGLDTGGAGIKTAIRVRIMHVFVRRKLLQHPQWHLQDWGVPISQGDALITLLSGSVVPGYHLRLMGFRPSRKEILAMMHFWRYVGHLMGVQPPWYPESIIDAVRFAYLVFTKGVGLSGADEFILNRSFALSFRPGPDEGRGWWRRLRAQFDHHVLLGYVNFFASSKTLRRSGVPGAGLWRWYPLAGLPLRFLMESLRRWLPPLDALCDRYARWTIKRWFARHMHQRKAEYTAVANFTR